jgi:hypothetical protein
MATWDATYESLPLGTGETGSSGDDRIRSIKAEIGDRFDQEHSWMNTGSTGQTVHKKGAARAYYAATAPALRPDAATALGAATDDGRLWVDSGGPDGYIWEGTAFGIINGHTMLDQGGGTHLKCKIIETGVWDLTAGGTTYFAHGLTMSTIRDVDIFVVDSGGTKMEPLKGHGFVTLITVTGTPSVAGTVSLGYFGGKPEYSAATGFIVIWYAED